MAKTDDKKNDKPKDDKPKDNKKDDKPKDNKKDDNKNSSDKPKNDKPKDDKSKPDNNDGGKDSKPKDNKPNNDPTPESNKPKDNKPKNNDGGKNDKPKDDKPKTPNIPDPPSPKPKPNPKPPTKPVDSPDPDDKGPKKGPKGKPNDPKNPYAPDEDDPIKNHPKGPGKPDAPDEDDPIKDHPKGGGKGKGDKGNDLTVVPGQPNKHDPGQMNVVDYAGQLATDPNLGFTKDNPKTKGTNESMKLEDHLTSDKDVRDMTKSGLIDDKQLKMDPNRFNVDKPDKVDKVKEAKVDGYNVATTQQRVENQDIKAAKGKITDNDQVDAAQINMKKVAKGAGLDSNNPDAAVGEALAKYAAVNMSNVIDTSTSAGKLLAQQLGDGNYVDSKATLKGQLDILQQEFVDPQTGEAKIPSWAAGTARNVSKIAAFKGMSGSAATAAMAQALLEASIPIAQADSQFFQTLTLQNLDNRQQSIINTANTLAKFEQTNVDNRMAAAIQNSKNFMDMDMANLSNEQQAKVINNQQRVQSILEDAKSKNAERLFESTTQADLDKFYDSLNTQISQYNSSQHLDAQKFNATLDDSREKFEKEMSYNIDIANAKWRQEVQLNEDQQQFEAATTDVKNMVDLSVNQLNQIWDRSDALLDYAWKSSENDLNRKNDLAKIALAGDQQMDAQMMESLGLLAGTFVGSGVGQSLLKGIFGL